MERLNTVVNENRTFLYKLLSDDDTLVTKEMTIVAGKKIKGLLPFSIITKESGVELRYEISSISKLSDYLKSVSDKQKITELIMQILDIMYDLNNNGLDLSKIVFDTNEVLINYYSGNIYFVYIPVQNYNAGYLFSDFLLRILTESSIDKNDSFYLGFKDYVNNKSINLFELKKYISYFNNNKIDINVGNMSLREANSYASNYSNSSTKDVGLSSVPYDIKDIQGINTHNTKKLQ